MRKYYVEFIEKQTHFYGYYADANSPEQAYKLAEERYYNDLPPDTTQMIDNRYLKHTVEEA